MPTLDGMTREELVATFSDEEIFERFVIRLMRELHIDEPEKLLAERLEHSEGLREYRQEMRRRLKHDPPKTEEARQKLLEDFLLARDRFNAYMPSDLLRQAERQEARARMEAARTAIFAAMK